MTEDINQSEKILRLTTELRDDIAQFRVQYNEGMDGLKAGMTRLEKAMNGVIVDASTVPGKDKKAFILAHLQAISEDLSSAKSSLSGIEASQGATIELLGRMAGNIAQAQATLGRDSNGAL